MDMTELRDLLAAWIILSVAFANLLGGLTLVSVGAALGTAGLGFLLHELAHRAVARKYGLAARFVADYTMLGLALAVSFAGFIFAAPGAVVTQGRRTPKIQTLISAAGPATNIALAAVFFLIPAGGGVLDVVLAYGFRINAWLALFNMIPFGGLDGQAIYQHNRPLFFAMVAISGVMVFVL